MQNMEDALTNRSQDAGEKTEFTTYGTLPTNIDFSKVVVPCSEITDALSGCFDIDTKIALKSYADSFLRDQKLLVNVMAKQFDMKKAADVNRRAKIAKTGVLDTVKMVNYKFSDDIFLRNTVLPKTRLAIIMVDWSGSMDNMMGDATNGHQPHHVLQAYRRPVRSLRFHHRPDSSSVRFPSWVRTRARTSSICPVTDSISSKPPPQPVSDRWPVVVNMVAPWTGSGSTVAETSRRSSMAEHDYYMMDRRLGLGGTPLDDAINNLP